MNSSVKRGNFMELLTCKIPKGGGGGTPIQVCAAQQGCDFEAPDLERGRYPFQKRFLEWGIIFRTHESSSFVSSHLKLFKDRLLFKIRFNALTSKLLYSCCTLCFSMQGGCIFGVNRKH